MNKKLAQQLNALAKRDQEMRNGTHWNTEIDRENTRTLKEIVKKFGWPTCSLVGKDASQNAWLIAQHADHDVRFQKKVLQLMKEALRHQDIAPQNIAYLTDRIDVNEKKPQHFGTQFYVNKKGQLVPRTIRDRKRLTQRRRLYDLGSFIENWKRVKQVQRRIQKKKDGRA